MHINSGYLNNSRTDFKDNSTPLVVGSCGTYRLKTRPKLPTYWQKGRRDYQILYVANGKTHFWFDGKEEIVSAGHMVLYKPEEIQKYVYYLEDNPEVFWIHFTGSDVKNILAYHGISLDEHVFYCGVLPDYKALFRKIIQELQLCRYGYEDYIASLFNDILLLVDRQQHEQKKATGNVQEQIERATAYFNENYNTKISIDDYAESLHISTNWFIHNFKQYAGMSPAQYILSLRMVNAQSLLERTTYNIKEISEIVGYDGKLTTDDYVALLGRLDDFRKIGVPIQCDVDDARMIQGFHNRKAKIIKGDICEERGHRRLMRDEEETRLTPQEQTLNKEIEKFQDQWPYLMNEIFFMDYLKNPTYEKGLAAKSIVLVCFDDELLTAFLSAYKEANISEQQEMLTTLKEISFRGGVVERDETDIETTRKNFEKLENALHSEAEHANDAVKKFYANRHLEVVKQIRQKL